MNNNDMHPLSPLKLYLYLDDYGAFDLNSRSYIYAMPKLVKAVWDRGESGYVTYFAEHDALTYSVPLESQTRPRDEWEEDF